MPPQRYASVLLFGAPGVGKGTQGRILGTIPGFFHLSSGDMFRSLDVGSEDGRQAYEYFSRGELVPDDLTIRLFQNALDGRMATSDFKPREDLLVMDGIPRTVHQAEILERHFDVRGVVYLVCRNEERMIHRIKRRAIKENRVDDANEATIRRRFGEYREKTEPVIEHYSDDIVHEVDALGSPAEVLYNVLEVVIPIQNEVFRAGA